MRNLSTKTQLLVVQATTKRVGELQGCFFLVAVQGEDIILSYILEFVAKADLVTSPVAWEFDFSPSAQ